ncbi:MAG: Rpn family recombination-promoting nuclease/putative transposase [Lachnospiraceae bacterium]|nr:Rpn family recombination-promoting nuclease/putative transposase [Lachnospiraceae bacterium]
MVEKDIKWKDYLKDPFRYADFINAFGFDGEQIVSAADITFCDTANTDGTSRDLCGDISLGFQSVIIGVENQENMDYSYPVREMGYTYKTYDDQVKVIKAFNRNNPQALDDREYLYKFKRTDKLIPTITYLLYAGEDDWDGPTKLSDMLDIDGLPEKLRKALQDYEVQLIDIHKLTEEDINKLKTDLQYVFDLIRVSKDAKKFQEVVQNNPEYYDRMPEDAYNLISAYTSFGKVLKIEIVEGEVKMCKAIDDLIEQKLEEGKMEGAQEMRTAITNTLSLLGKISENLQATINNQTSFSVLIKWLQIATRAESIEQFEKNIV